MFTRPQIAAFAESAAHNRSVRASAGPRDVAPAFAVGAASDDGDVVGVVVAEGVGVTAVAAAEGVADAPGDPAPAVATTVGVAV